MHYNADNHYRRFTPTRHSGINEHNEQSVKGIIAVRRDVCGLDTSEDEAMTIYRSLRRMQATVQHRNELQCGDERQWKRYERNEQRYEREETEVFAPRFASYFPGLTCKIDSDPRGYALKIIDERAALLMPCYGSTIAYPAHRKGGE